MSGLPALIIMFLACGCLLLGILVGLVVVQVLTG